MNDEDVRLPLRQYRNLMIHVKQLITDHQAQIEDCRRLLEALQADHDELAKHLTRRQKKTP